MDESKDVFDELDEVHKENRTLKRILVLLGRRDEILHRILQAQDEMRDIDTEIRMLKKQIGFPT